MHLGFLANAASDPSSCMEPWEFHCNGPKKRSWLDWNESALGAESHVLNFDLTRLNGCYISNACNLFPSGSAALRVYMWSPPVFVFGPCVRAPYLTSHLRNEAIWDGNLWNTYEDFTLPFSQVERVHDPDSHSGSEKSLTSPGSARKVQSNIIWCLTPITTLKRKCWELVCVLLGAKGGTGACRYLARIAGFDRNWHIL